MSTLHAGLVFFLSFLSERLNATERGEGREAVDGIDGELGTRDTGGYFFFSFFRIVRAIFLPNRKGKTGSRQSSVLYL